MASCFPALVIVIHLLLWVNAELPTVDQACNLASHHSKQSFSIDKRSNIYGNETVKESLAWTWNRSSCETKLNKQINIELYAQYTYLSMASHFDRDDIMLHGFAKFFREAAEEENKHAQMLMAYQNRRGGRVKLAPIMKPCRDQWGNGHDAMKEALILEKTVYMALLDLHRTAATIDDFQLMDFIESNFLGEQIESIKTLANYVNTLKRVGHGLGEYQFDKLTLGK